MKLTKKAFGAFQGKIVWQYTFENDHGIRLKAMNYGATLNRIDIPDRTGRKGNIVLGYDRFEDYLKQDAYFGATVGRVAGRIAGGRFSVDGHDYQLVQNNEGNTCHGGPKSFESQLWESEPIETNENNIGVQFSLVSPDGFNGFPGNLHVSVSYLLNNHNEWQLRYQAETDKATLFNPTNHVYFNLSGDFSRTVDEDILMLNSSRYGAIQPDGVPTGQLVDVSGTVFDFMEGAAIGRGFHADDPQIRLVGGYDHPFLFNDPSRSVAVLENTATGRRVSMHTTNNSVIIYTGNGFSSDLIMDEKPMRPHLAVTLEAQMMPDAIHHEGFGNTIIRPGEKYESETVYCFSAQ